MNDYETYMSSPVGLLRIVDNGEAITEIELLKQEEMPQHKELPDPAKSLHQKATSQNMGSRSVIGSLAKKQLEEYFAGTRTQFDLPLQANGTPFQKKVWEALCDIPYGETRSYQDIAIAVGNPNGSRAIGMANHNNPVIIVVPCHRVIGKNGKLVGYGGGLNVKEALLKLESSQVGEK